MLYKYNPLFQNKGFSRQGIIHIVDSTFFLCLQGHLGFTYYQLPFAPQTPKCSNCNSIPAFMESRYLRNPVLQYSSLLQSISCFVQNSKKLGSNPATNNQIFMHVLQIYLITVKNLNEERSEPAEEAEFQYFGLFCLFTGTHYTHTSSTKKLYVRMHLPLG